MRPSRRLLIPIVLAVAAAYRAGAFVPQGCSTPWRTATSTHAGATAQIMDSRQQQQQAPSTCSSLAINSRPNRPMTTTTMYASSTNREDGGELSAGGSSEEVERKKEAQHQRVRWLGIRRSLARGAASLATFTVGATALSGLSAEVQHRTGGRVSMPAAMKSAEASIVKPFTKRTVEEKVANLPAFMVTNIKGSPFLAPTEEEGYQLAVFFTNLDDAKEMLREMAQSSTYERDARILVVSMEKAYTMVKAGPRPTGYMNENGMEETMDFKLEQDMHSMQKAKNLGLGVNLNTEGIDIPVFYADGLEIKRDGGMVSPLFMDPADLIVAWDKAAAENPDMPERPDVKVFNLPEVLIAMEISNDFNEFGFFPSTENAKYIQQARNMTKTKPKSRLGRMWSF